MKRRISQLLFIALAAASVTAGKGSVYAENLTAEVLTETEENGTPLAGGWVMAEEEEIPGDAQAAFDRATDGLEGAVYEPVKFLAYQTVSGVNYAFLCQITEVYPDAQPDYSIVYVYEDIEGEAEIVRIQELASTPEEAVSGGWAVIGTEGKETSEAAVAALKKAGEELVGAEYEPVQALAAQIVAGMNYLLLCKVTPVYPDAQAEYCLVTVYEDLDGEAEITALRDLIFSLDEDTEVTLTGKVIEPLEGTVNLSDLTEAYVDVAFAEDKDVNTDADGETYIRMDVYETVLYDAVDISLLAVGDILKIDDEEITVETIEETEDGIRINGDDSYILSSAGGGTYAWIGASDYRYHVKAGEVTLPVGEDFQMFDSSDQEKPEQVITREEFIENAAGSDRIYTPGDTAVRIVEGYVVELRHVYTP